MLSCGRAGVSSLPLSASRLFVLTSVLIRRHLSIVSLLDGRTFDTCDTAVKVPSSSRAEGTRFADLQVANLAEVHAIVCDSLVG